MKIATPEELCERDYRIVAWLARGDSVPIRCTQCGATGETKNIGYIGMRHIYVPCGCPVDKFEPIRPLVAADEKERYQIAMYNDGMARDDFHSRHPDRKSLKEIAAMFEGQPHRMASIIAYHVEQRSRIMAEYEVQP